MATKNKKTKNNMDSLENEKNNNNEISLKEWKKTSKIPDDPYNEFIADKKYENDVKKSKEEFDKEYEQFLNKEENNNFSLNKWKNLNNIPTALFKGFLAHKKLKKSAKKSKEEFDKEFNDFLNQKAF